MKPIHIALVMAQTTGGIGRHVSALASESARRGGIVSVFGPDSARSFRFEAEGVKFIPLDIPQGLAPLRFLAWASRLVRGVRGMDIVHAHGLRAGVVSGVAARWAGVPNRIATIHNAVLDRTLLRAAAADLVDRLLAWLMTVRIFVSPDLAETARAADPSRRSIVEVLPVGADVSSIEPAEITAARERTGTPPETPLVIAVGRLHRQKGFDLLVRSVSHVSYDPAPVFLIAGEGPERFRLMELIASLGLKERVRLLGERPDARALVASADVFCMSSRWEGSPMALHEAMAAGRPIVATKVGGITEMLDETSALLVPAEDPIALGIAIRRILEDRSLAARLAEAAAKAAAAWPDSITSAERVVDLYERILARPLGRA